MIAIDALLDFLTISETQGYYYIALNYGMAVLCSILAIYSLFRSPERLARPAFLIAVMVMVFYQWPLASFSQAFHEKTANAWWLATSIHSAVLANLLWVRFTPYLNNHNIFKGQYSNVSRSFNKFELWFSIALFFVLALSYLHRVPFHCTALFAIFFDPGLASLIRELAVKLVGTNYATYSLSILTSTVSTIVVFLSSYMIYLNFRMRKFIWIPLWLILIMLVVASNLLSGAKGNLIPTFVAVTVAGFLSANKWRWRIIIVVTLNVVLAFILSFFDSQHWVVDNFEKKGYQFGSCVVALNACEDTKVLLNSLKARDFSLNLTKDTVARLEKETARACSGLAMEDNDVADGVNSAPGDEVNVLPDTVNLTPHEAIIASRYSSISIFDWLNSIIDRAFVTPIVVADWHFLYVAKYGAPGFAGISIAKRFTDDYVNMPSKICEIYEFLRSGGDRTSTCTAPTSYLFTYPAYMGFAGLLIACLATLSFDVLGALIIKYSAPPITYLAVGLIAVTGINFMTADFTTVMMSHGAGTSLAILSFFCICRFLMGRYGRQ